MSFQLVFVLIALMWLALGIISTLLRRVLYTTIAVGMFCICIVMAGQF